MPRPSPQPVCNIPPTEPLVCAGCGLLCDDLDPGSLTTTSWACPAAARWFTAANSNPAIDGVPATPSEALDLAVRRLLTARRVLVTGLTAAPLEALQPACQIADLLAAAIDAGAPETAVPTGPTFARVGEVTAAFEELRDRADLIIFWNCDPAATHPRFIERFVQPAGPSGSRRTISLGPHPVMPASSSHLHFALAAEEALPAARLLQKHLHQHPMDPLDEPLATVMPQLAAAVDAAECVGIATSRADRSHRPDRLEPRHTCADAGPPQAGLPDSTRRGNRGWRWKCCRCCSQLHLAVRSPRSTRRRRSSGQPLPACGG